MSRLAQIVEQNGLQVSGSDIALEGHNAKFVENADLVVYSSAIPPSNPEIKYALKNKIPLMSRAEFLGALSKSYDNLFAVCGCHGKTTTCAMLYSVMKHLSPTLHFGGNIKDSGIGNKKIFISEACEYKRNFLTLSPSFAIITNIDFDHPDCYKNLDEVKDAYSAFYDKCGCVFVNADDKNSEFLLTKSNSISYGFSPQSDFRATTIIPSAYGYSFTVLHKNTPIGDFSISIKGVHNIYNALSCIACAYTFGVDKTEILRGLKNFDGVMRRNEYICNINSCAIYADYAHHPREIYSEITLLKSMSKRVLIIFQPHTFSRTKSLFNGFVSSLSCADECWILPTYSAREKGKDNGSLHKAIAKNTPSIFVQKHEVCDLLNIRANEFNAVCFMGAGDVYDIALSLKNNENSN